MDKSQISEVVNQFVKMTTTFKVTPDDLRDMHIMLSRGDGYWDLTAEGGSRPPEAKLWLKFPEWDGKDKLDLQIELAGFLSQRLNQYFAKVKANASRSAEARKASARKAINTRWHK